MTRHDPIKPATPAQHLADAAASYAEAKARDPQEAKEVTQYAWLVLQDAICAVVPDGDAAEAASQARFDLGLDEEGLPVDEFGFPVRTFDPARVHPNNPSQSGGYL